ncbi:MAG: Membrane protein insertase YidC [Alphaproteobacteria bacterium MarineAlpha5_Bin8]|nr:MAG: Membrane protein insertase YidC [Alphaproteobacteria bacterium MarineAlpha5_Bin7]PPR47601.1 MAG: Membrane protein insertase YidC [Alphaproteobacteria bacterium MarineAlpha5_Bin8]PPR53385.1 MAG: Membrane protein insertase YidC [Alphaproteobacteria bacterium MarineAlpha5_Bin6]|tara:strand:+ start:1350 stop:3086 length:1737 start_codon:yes stop_codon:yes gene_type:complete
MGEQKNLFLAIILSIAIIVIFQLLFPQQSVMTPVANNENDQLQPATSIDDNQITTNEIIKSKEEIIETGQRISINTPSLQGSINLRGAVLDDLILLNYRESLDKKSKNITLFAPDGTSNPYYVETGWKQLSNSDKINLPDLETNWRATSENLTPDSPVSLIWVNDENVVFKIHFTVDNDYMFNITQEIENNSQSYIEVFPYRLIKRINLPDTINFFILHEGLISLLNDELLEKKYTHLSDDCSSNNAVKKEFCDQKTSGGWLGFTDKYWMSSLIPNNEESITVNYRHNNNGRDSYRVGYVGKIFNIKPSSSLEYTGNLFAGAKVLKILSKYEEQYNIIRFEDAIDWGWFSFLTKPIFIAINWFNGIVGNFGIAIVAFTVLMRLILFPLAHTSFKSMAKMKKLQPEMQRLKETYPDDRQKMQQELMALYKKEGANPVAGCLPIVVQIPIFFSLYKVLFVTIEMYHAPFYGWIHDLSAPDPLGILILFGLIPWQVPEWLSIINIGILPIIMGFTMWLQQKLNPAPTDPTQAKIFAFLPFVFTFILAGFAAGLVLYWAVNNILSIAQQWVIQRKILAKKDV